MKLNSFHRMLLLLKPILVFSVLSAISPAQAVTFSTSQSEVKFFDFNLEPDTASLSTNANATAVAVDGNAIALPLANTELTVLPTTLSGIYNSTAAGEGFEYEAIAQSQVQFIGQFLVRDVFSFNFQAALNLATAIDDPLEESAGSFASVAFFIFEGTSPASGNLLDAFNLTGNLDTPGHNDFLRRQTSDNVSLAPGSLFSRSFGGVSESAQASVTGSYQRLFDSPTYVTLVQQTTNQANVAAVPEPTTMLGVALAGGVGVFLKRRQKTRPTLR